MTRISTGPRWSTLTLLGVGMALGSLGYVAGRRGSFSPVPQNKEAAIGVAGETPRTPPGPSSASLNLVADLDPGGSWRELATHADIPGREQAMAALLEKIAERDHLRALALAEAEPNWRLRTLLRNAALRGWASAAPAAAAEFTLTLPEHERREAVAAVFLGAAGQPETAATIAATLCARDPAFAEECGRALIEALTEAGAFSTLVHFAAADTSGHGADWLNATFYQWAEREPAAARQALDSLPADAARQAAFQGLALGWSMANPRELADYAVTMPEGGDRSLALRQALAQWFPHDPDAVAGWVAHFDPGPDFDLSAAAVATLPKLVEEQPAVALGWAQSIVEPALRESTLVALARQWAKAEPGRAQMLATRTPGLLSADRRALLEGLDSAEPEEPGGP